MTGETMTATDPHDCATWDEIMRQPAIWRRWGAHLAAALPELRDWVVSSGADAIWLSGAGTSAFIGDLVAAGLDGLCDVPVLSRPSTDLVAAPHRFMRGNPLVISFGRSGDSAESVGVMDALDALLPDAPRLNITCNGDSALARRAGPRGRVLVLPEDTHDSGFAMTSSYSTMLLSALAILDPETGDPAARLAALADRAEALIPKIIETAAAFSPAQRIVFTGTGSLGFAAREAALKVMELTAGQVPALWETSLGFRHGPKSFVLPGTALVLFRSADSYSARYDADLVAELSTQFPDAPRLTVGPGCDLETGVGPDHWSAVLYVLVAQILAVHWSARMGLSVDDPFAGRGTLTRVVSGVTLYDPREA